VTPRGRGERKQPGLKEMEALWKQNKALRKRAVSTELWALPPDQRAKELQAIPDRLRRPYKAHGFARPKGLRGPVLIEYLWNLGLIWRDKRFDDCVNALLEHGIVAPRHPHVFTDDKHGPEIDAANRRQRSECLEAIRLLTEEGMAEKTACAKVAAEWGLPANSFEAAEEQLRHRFRQSLGKRRPSKRSAWK
jgi:hypothetical protein